MGRERAQSFALATFGATSLTADNRVRRCILLRLDAKVADVKSNRADTFVQFTRNGGLSHSRGEHFANAFPQFRFGKVMRVGHLRSVSHGRQEKRAGRSARSLSGHRRTLPHHSFFL